MLITVETSSQSVKRVMISERSCDTEYWSNDTENYRNKLQFKIYYNTKKQFF